MKKILLGFYISFLLSHMYLKQAGAFFGTERISDTFKNGTGDGDLVLTVDNILGYLIGLLYFVAVVIAIYGGFLILVSGGDEEKLKKGRNYIIYMVVGFITIFLASQIVTWAIDVMSDSSAST